MRLVRPVGGVRGVIRGQEGVDHRGVDVRRRLGHRRGVGRVRGLGERLLVFLRALHERFQNFVGGWPFRIRHAGTGRADPTSLIEALNLAAEMVAHRAGKLA